MARIAVYTASQNPAHDTPTQPPIPKDHARHLLAMGRARRISTRVIQLLSVKSVTDPALVSAAGYDQSAGSPPVGYRHDDETRLLFGQMWEKRESIGFQILQLCPPHRKSFGAEPITEGA